MKILHIITSLRTGGAERLVAELAQRHQAYGDEVEVLLFDGTRTPLVEELEKNGIPVHAVGKGFAAMSNPLLLPALARFLRKHPFDFVHTHNTSCQILTAMVPALTRFTTEHGTINRRRNWRWFRPIDRWMYGRYSRIVCVGEETRKTLSDWLNRPELDKKMTVIPNGIDLQRIMNASPAEELCAGPSTSSGTGKAIDSGSGTAVSSGTGKAKGTGTGTYKILMVSAFRPEKDQQTLIRAIQQLPEEYQLFLAGGAETPENQKIMDDCKTLAMSPRVHFLGVRPDVPNLLAAADAVVLSSKHEGMSLSVLEGMASGKPMIASDVEGMRDLVGGAGLLFPLGDAETLATLIREVCENPEKAKEIGNKCRERAMQYDIAETANRYHALYEEVLAAPKLPLGKPLQNR